MLDLCKNCQEPIYKGAMDHHVHREDGSRNCSPDPTDPREAEWGIRAWETGHPNLLIAGTTDRGLAETAARRFYQEATGDVPEDLHQAVRDAELCWVNRHHPDYDAERWPDDVTSEVQRPGDTPLLAHGW